MNSKLFATLAILIPCVILQAQGYDDTFEMRSKLKVEYQYSDYFTYEYPEPIYYYYGLRDYSQNLPYLANFPEHRALVKFSHLVGGSTALSVKYQFSDLREEVDSHLWEFKITRSMGPGFTALAGAQAVHDTRGFTAWQPGVGFRWEISPLTIIQADAQYYYRGKEAVELGGDLGSLNLRCKLRQVLTISTAVLLEYIYYDASGQSIDFRSHTVSLWLSQFLPTQTALHLNLRWYDNTMGIQSLAPSLEVAQYLNWATILRIKYRYYANNSENVSLGEQDIIIPDNLRSNTVGIQLTREITTALLGYIKYRYYKSNQGIEMNTYLTGCVISF